MYEYFEALLKERGMTVAEVSKLTGIGQNTFSNWKARKSILSTEYLFKLAKVFNVPMEYFLGGNVTEWNEEEKKLEQKEGYYTNEDAKEYAQFLFDNPEYRILFDAARDVDVKDLQKAITMLGLFKKEDE